MFQVGASAVKPMTSSTATPERVQNRVAPVPNADCSTVFVEETTSDCSDAAFVVKTNAAKRLRTCAETTCVVKKPNVLPDASRRMMDAPTG